MLEETFAMVRKHDDRRVVAQAAGRQSVDQGAEALIEILHLAVVQPAQLLPARRGHLQGPPDDGGQDDAVRALADGWVELALHVVFSDALVIDVRGVRLEGDGRQKEAPSGFDLFIGKAQHQFDQSRAAAAFAFLRGLVIGGPLGRGLEPAHGK